MPRAVGRAASLEKLDSRHQAASMYSLCYIGGGEIGIRKVELQTSAKLDFLVSTERLRKRYVGSGAQNEHRGNSARAREHNCVASWHFSSSEYCVLARASSAHRCARWHSLAIYFANNK